MSAKILFVVMLATIAVGSLLFNQPQHQQEKSMIQTVFEMKKLSERRAQAGRTYLQFLDVPTMHCGIYHLPAGSTDGQSPHIDDEVYYVERGRGKFFHQGDSVDVKPGTILFVPARQQHYFHDIEEDLNILVFFSKARPPAEDPADSSDRPAASADGS